MALSPAQEKELRETAEGLKASIAALEAMKDKVDRSATIAMEKGLLASIEKQFSTSAKPKTES